MRRAVIAGISLSISNPKSIASELKASNPALRSVHVDNTSLVETTAALIVLSYGMITTIFSRRRVNRPDPASTSSLRSRRSLRPLIC